MNAERWAKVEDIYHAAVARDVAARASFLDSVCGSDVELREEVESLLRRESRAGDFLESRSPTLTHAAGPPAEFGPYRVTSRIGAGGMGEVYRAHDSKLGRDVALKTLPREFAAHPERLARFRREARLLAALNHPNIAAIYGLEESEGAICLVLELVEGESLRGPLPVKQALEYARQVAEALEAAHAQGIIHRDLKPANVKVTPQGRVKVLDFGLAKALWASEENAAHSQAATITALQTAVGQIAGTPPYMSPEQARGGMVDQRTDIWAFGCLLYELLSGKRAFGGDTLPEVLDAVLEHEPGYAVLPSKTPAKVKALLRRCLDKDLTRRPQNIRQVRSVLEDAVRGRPRWPIVTAAALVSAALAAAAILSLRDAARVPGRDQWVQLTRLPDSVSQPSLSSDGRMLTFVRGPSTFYGLGQIYVKLLPNGEPTQLTHDDFRKLGPVFSPDGSRIAYTTVDADFHWDTWTVPVMGGAPARWLQNTSGLIWKDDHTILFSELLVGNHMALETAEVSRAGERPVYVPEKANGMAHRSYPSPDGHWVLVVEMDGAWLPCRLVSMDGRSMGRQVGPPGAACTFAAWSPDGKWMYFTSSAGGGFHTWRQRFPNGRPEQITFGPSEEEGIAISPDGRSLTTAVGQRQRSVMLHTRAGDRQVALEGYTYTPKFIPGSNKLCYRLLKGSQPGSDPTELWIADLDSGRSEPLAPGFAVVGGQPYAISPDGTEVVFSARNRDGIAELWTIPVDRHSPPERIPDAAGNWPLFAPDGEIYFRSTDGFVYRMRANGSGRRRVLEQHVSELRGLSPDGQWLVVQSTDPSKKGGEGRLQGDFAYPTGGGAPIRICGNDSLVKWSPDRKFVWITGFMTATAAGGIGKSYIFPLARGRMLPEMPAGGFRSDDEMARYPGVRVIDTADFAFGPTLDVYALSKETAQRNLFRIPLP